MISRSIAIAGALLFSSPRAPSRASYINDHFCARLSCAGERGGPGDSSIDTRRSNALR